MPTACNSVLAVERSSEGLSNPVVKAGAIAAWRNAGIATLMSHQQRIWFDPEVSTDLYIRQCSLSVTARDLALMAATLVNGGRQPCSGKQVIDAVICQHVLAVMVTAGLYETSGNWLYAKGLPGKSGVSGGMITVAPGKGRLATFSPPLDEAGNRVRGQLTARFLSERLGLNLFASRPEGSDCIKASTGIRRATVGSLPKPGCR